MAETGDSGFRGFLGEEEPCRCMSGKAYRACHLDSDLVDKNRAVKVQMEGGPILSMHVDTVAAELEQVTEFPLPSWLLGQARDLAAGASGPSGGEEWTIMTVIMSAIAAEAVVNRLLEPRTPPEKWAGRKGIERKATLDRKWIVSVRRIAC
jgi:hypothetical protein